MWLLSVKLVWMLIATDPGLAAPQMVHLPGGRFEMGCTGCTLSDALPLHSVALSAFWLSETPVTNAEYAEFVAQTRYQTVAEIKPSAVELPSVPPDLLVAGSAVFTPPKSKVSLDDALGWWRYVEGASWKHPEGPKSSVDTRPQHPVVHIAYADAVAYCNWAGMRLPTEAEFEYAARGGLKAKKYAWGNQLKPGGHWVANVWQGRFPDYNSRDDHYAGTSPVHAFPANGYGIYDMSGNVWQWTADWYRPDYYQQLSEAGLVHNPRGPESSFDPRDPGVAKRVQRGGSFLCSDQYCTRYLVGSRGKGAVDSGGSNTGFRCAKDSQ